MKAPEVIDRWTPTYNTIRNTVKVWVKEKCTKRDLLDLARYVARVKSLYADDRAFTANKEMMHVLELPATLNSFLIFIFGVEWRNRTDYPIMPCLLEYCKSWRINPRSTPPRDHSRVHEDNTGVPIDPESN